MTVSQIDSLLKKGVARIIDESHLRERLERGDKLKIKLGIDPSGTVIHLGHMVPILKLRQFQELGHEVTIIIGDATGMIGDASDKDSERPMLMREQTRANGKAFIEKFARVLDLSKVNIVYNSDWLDKVNFAGVGELAKNFSVAEMLDRDNFSKRYKAGVRISLQEFLYPLMQGYDSVALHTDVELGGTEQYFNLLAGRRLQEAFGQEKQDIMMFDLLVGSDGKKMSKTSPNSVAIDEAPQSMYQKLISIKDELIVPYFELTTDATLDEVAIIRERLKKGEHPNILKEELAQRIITMYHGKSYDPSDSSNVESVFFDFELFPDEFSAIMNDDGTVSVPISYLLKWLLFCSTSGDVRNALAGKSVRVNGEVIEDPKYNVMITNEGVLVEMGKKKAKRVTL
ncbi:tyrosine--tRNA ligase [Candidatus Gracilibacteria bacterium]|nr:tyrosine--tRNA ligase [Candidatus Gracilibacteria bacterium]